MTSYRLLPVAVAATLLASTTAGAQTAGFAVNRFDPSERGSDWFANESLDLRGHLRPAVGIVGDFAHQPLAIYNADGSLRAALIDYQFFTHLGGSLVLWDRLRVGADLPFMVYQDGNGGKLAGVTYGGASGFSLGDVRIGADVRLVGEYGSIFTLAAGLQAWLPTGTRADYTGDENLRLGPRVMAAGAVGIFVYSARLGFQYRGLDGSFGGAALGSETSYGVAVGLRSSDHKLTAGPEVYGSTTVADSSQIFKTQTTPAEGLIGVHYRLGESWNIGGGAGAGLTRGLGSPAMRIVAAIEWAPGLEKKAPPPPDRDGDGIVDADDACPDVKGPRTDDPKTNGCPPPPPPPDRDGDGIVDADDACPDVKGIHTDDPKTNGCPPPPPDRDGDGIVDTLDACPDVKGEASTDPKQNGCPPDPDRDKDGIPNDQDACPDEPGPKNADPKKNGCPAAVVKDNQIVILEQVKFATASAKILPASDAILGAVLKVLQDHPEIARLSVQGHTDNQGNAADNRTLSGARAASVVDWLVKHGIDSGRLMSVGYGQDRPIDTNATPAGRQNNRRVEFRIGEEPPK